MIRLCGVSLMLPALTVAALVGTDALGFAFVPSLIVVGLITGFAVLAAGWTIHRSIGGSRDRQQQKG